LIKSNTKRYVSKNSNFTTMTKKTTHVTTELCPGVRLAYNKIGFEETIALIDNKEKDKSQQKKHTVDESGLNQL